jgi:hypothetical protein
VAQQEYEQSRAIDAPPEEVFAWLSDVGNLPKYLPPVVDSHVEGHPAPKDGRFLRRVHEPADGQPEEIVSALENVREYVVGPVNRCHAAEGDRQGNQRPHRRGRLTPHASGRSQRLPRSYLGPIQGVCDVRHLAGYYAQSYEESTPAGSRQGR